MIRQTIVSASMVLLLGTVTFACKGGGVGDPCIPNEEFFSNVKGSSETGTQIEDRSFQCETRVCLVKNFRGRVSCPFGNAEGRGNRDPKPDWLRQATDDEWENCYVPGTNIRVTQPVQSQCKERLNSVYCSCRCDGDDKSAKYCKCPDGFQCKQASNALDESIASPNDKYCIKDEKVKFDEGSKCYVGCEDSEDNCPFRRNKYETE